MTVFSLACSRCCRGWTSRYPQEVCGRCGQLCTSRGAYQVVELRRGN